MDKADIESRAEPHFVGPDGPVDIAVIVVTYNSVQMVGKMLQSLRDSSDCLSLRVIVVDNASSDGTLAFVRSMADVIAVDSGGNIGYAAGINLGMRSVGQAGSVLILNADLQVHPGALSAMNRRLRQPGVGCVVPAVLDRTGELTLSVRREPSLAAAAGDAAFGSHWPSRPEALSQVVRSRGSYTHSHRIDWATGAALLVDHRVAEQVGDWDERFFLYSEETDFFRRIRDRGHEIWFEPEAQVTHIEAGSGRSPELVALTIVNGIRYAEKHHRSSAAPLRLILLIHEMRRWGDPTHRVALQALLHKRRWADLPHAQPHAPIGPLIDHLLVTRFNLPSRGPESVIRAQDGWLQSRIQLFERYTVPSVRAQTIPDFRWLVYLDPESPKWLLDRLAPLTEEGLFETRFREEVSWKDLAADARELTGAHADLLITTNLDNDDALSVDFVNRIQTAAREGIRGAVYLANGLIKAGGRSFLWRDRDNAFCNVIETWENPQTAWRDWHILLGQHMPVTVIEGAPGWLQVIHGRNVSNRMRGRIIDPVAFRGLFPGALDDIASPDRIELLEDAVISHPVRQMREAVRTAGKSVLLTALGKDGLERLKEKYRAVQ